MHPIKTAEVGVLPNLQAFYINIYKCQDQALPNVLNKTINLAFATKEKQICIDWDH